MTLLCVCVYVCVGALEFFPKSTYFKVSIGYLIIIIIIIIIILVVIIVIIIIIIIIITDTGGYDPFFHYNFFSLTF